MILTTEKAIKVMKEVHEKIVSKNKHHRGKFFEDEVFIGTHLLPVKTYAIIKKPHTFISLDSFLGDGYKYNIVLGECLFGNHHPRMDLYLDLDSTFTTRNFPEETLRLYEEIYQYLRKNSSYSPNLKAKGVDENYLSQLEKSL
jgi:hypothetical protein